MKSAKTLRPAGEAGALIRRNRNELAFLPAALEIVETPPSPANRAIAATIITLFILALAWATLSHVDVVAVAPGKIIPTGRTKYIQPFQIGVVREIHVRDGDKVSAGETLIELDSTLNDADFKHTQSDLMSLKVMVARLHASLSDGPDPLADFHPPDGADPTMVTVQRQYLLRMVAEERAKLDVLDRQKAQKEADKSAVAATIGKDQALLPVLQQQVDIRQTLMEHQTGSKVNYLDALQQLILTQQDLNVQQGNLKSAAEAIEAINATRVQTDQEYRRTVMDSMADAEAKELGLEQDLIKAKEMQKRQVLTAPVDGTVQQLSVHTVGGVVTPGQPLMVIVPSESHIEIEAMISNRDIGFVHAGQEAEIKVDTFDFTRFGLLHGKVLTVSADTVTPGNNSNKDSSSPSGSPTGTDPGQPSQVGGTSSADGTPVYSALVSLDEDRMMVNNVPMRLESGMAVTVEIKTASRRVISYLLSPLLRFKEEALRER